MIGETVGSYRIVSKLSVGGMGTVFKAEHTLIGKLAAVKVLHPELSGSRDIVNRFFNEAKATTTIKHPGIVEVFDFGYMPSGHAYLVMEFLEGMSLARRLKVRGRMSEGEAAMMLRAVCSALAAAHAKGIVHRDLKPDNIFLVPDSDSAIGERPKLLDFGIAKLTDIGLAGSATKTGAVMGTPTYMSPEQCRGTGDVDHRADLYSLGCIFYELLAGRPPFTNLGAGELIGAHIYAEPERPSKYQPVSKDTEKLIMLLLSKRPERRPQTAKELAQRLSSLAQGLGWITVTSPDGITAQGLRDLANSGPTYITPDATEPPDLSRLVTTAPPVDPASSVTTPYGLDSESSSALQDSSAVDKPTTLSGAASQSVVDVPRRRRGIGIAFLAAAALGAGVFAVVKVTGDPADKIVPAAATTATPKPDPKPTPERREAEQREADKREADSAKVEAVKADVVKAEAEKAEVAAKAEAEKAEAQAKAEAVAAKSKKPARKKVDTKKPPIELKKPPTEIKTPPVELKPPPKKCDEPPCIEREGP